MDAGPWTAGRYGSITGGQRRELVRGTAYPQIALVTLDACDGDGDIRDANAHLIASAPELYDALDSLMELGIAIEGTHGYAFILKARAALAKARGER